MPGCSVCESEDRDEIELWGKRAEAGEVSWRTAAVNAGLKYHMPLKTHMDKHFVSEEAVREATLDAQLEAAIEDGVRELLERAAVSPADVRPLLLAAAKNLQGLQNTKPSQQSLIAAIKVTQELTGMKQEQRMLLEFSRHMFPQKVEATSKPVLELVEVEAVDE